MGHAIHPRMDEQDFNQWANMISNAEKLDDAELRRHASVSTDNRHRCTSCFTCAAAYAWKQRGLRRMVGQEAARRLHAGGA